MIDLTGKVALVTGGGRGIGTAIVRRLAGLGGAVVLHDLPGAAGAVALQQELGDARCRLVGADLAQPAELQRTWREALAWRGRIDVLVNNAGIYEPAPLEAAAEAWTAAWQRTLAVNLVAPAYLCREAILHYRGAGGGIIVNIASRAAFRGDDAEYQHYAASKAGVVAMTRTIARHHGREGVTAFAVAPGFVRTSLNDAAFRELGEEAICRDIPLGEMAEPEDIANLVAFLASGLARHATGTTVDINGASYVR
ncbi:MAG: SDR family oxidoreductase [Tardiphaga sp.]|jgi:3-oxoacyl-[acyl-carrier protein] reductase